MRSSLLSLLLVSTCLILSIHAQASSSSPCSAFISAKARADASWTIGDIRYQIYDITIINNGSCILTRIAASFTPMEREGFISEAWNYDISSGLFYNYGSALNIGQSFFGAGFVLANASQPMMGPASISCPESCGAATSAPSTASPTSNPSTSAPSTSNPSTSNPSTSAPTSCNISASVMRESHWWYDAEGKNNSVYRLTLTNNGPCALKDFVASFIVYPGTLISLWNLESVLGGYAVTGFGTQLAAGASFDAAGMILAGSPDYIAVNVYGSNCQC